MEVLVGPDFARRSQAGLHLVDDQKYVVFFRDRLNALEKLGRTVVVATFRLNRLGYDARHRSFLGIRVVLD